MKILQLTDSFDFCCGRSRYITLLSRELQKEGNEVLVIAGGGDGKALLEQTGIPIIMMPHLLHQHRSFINFIKGIIAFFFIQQEYHFDLVHVHCHYQSVMVRWTTLLFRIPHITTLHGIVTGGILPHYCGDYFIAVSEHVKQWALTKGKIPAQSIETISCGVSPKSKEVFVLHPIRQELGIQDGDFIVAMIGRIVRQKGHRTFLSALALLQKQIPIVGLIVGTGEEEMISRTMAREMNVRVIFTSSVNEPAKYYALADVVVIPSYDQEGLPMTLLEAGMWSKPVIASNLTGLTACLRQEQSGLLVKQQDADALADALFRLYHEPILRKSMGEQWHTDVVQKYSITSMAQNILRVYHDQCKQ